MPSSSSVSIRCSIRWLPGEATELTHTIVLTGDSGIFLDVRFKNGMNELDWAFAGYRHQISEDTVQFKHHIDSRTLDPQSVIDIGKYTTLPSRQALECGEMINPDTGEMTQYEEIWEDLPVADLGAFPQAGKEGFSKNGDETVWSAQVGEWRLGLGREVDGTFWAYQARFLENGEGWKVICATGDLDAHIYK